MRTTWASPSRRGFRLAAVSLLAIVGVLLIINAASPAVSRYLHNERVYPGVQVAGIDLSGQTTDEAASTIRSMLSQYGQTALTIKAGDSELALTAAELGFKPQDFDLARVAFDEGRDQGPIGFLQRTIAGQLLGPASTAEESLVDEQAVSAAVAKLATSVYRASVDAELSVSPRIILKPSATGQSLDQDGAKKLIWEQLVAMRTDKVVLPTNTLLPKVPTEQLSPIYEQASSVLERGMTIVPTSPVTGQGWAVPTSLLQSSLILRTGPYSLDVQESVFSSVVAGAAKDVYRDPVSASLTIRNEAVILTSELSGQVVDQAATLAALRKQILAGANTAGLVANTIPAKVRATDLKPTADEAQAIIAKGLTLSISGKVGGDGNEAVVQSYAATPAEMGNMLVLKTGTDGKLSVGINGEQISQLLDRFNYQYQYPSLTARFATFSGGKLTIKEGATIAAIVIDKPKAVAAINEKWRGGRVDLPTTVGQMVVDKAFADRLRADLKGVLKERSIGYYTASPERSHNIALALSRINGTVVAPGEVYSFNISTGPTTIASGYKWGFAFTTDKKTGQSMVVPSEAGGICQVATTIFQPLYLLGYLIEERNYHMFNIAGYAVNGYLGLDATVYPPYSDFRFRNNTDHYLLISSRNIGKKTYAAIVGTKPNWTVSIGKETITDRKPAPTETIRTTSDKYAKGRIITVEHPTAGFTSTITRTVTSPDGTVRTLTFKSVYKPAALQILEGTG